MSELSSKQRVLAVYPDAEANSNDHYYHWIGRKTLSDAFEQNWDDLDKVDAMPRETDEEVQACIDARMAVEQAAEDQAWDDAAAKLPNRCPER